MKKGGQIFGAIGCYGVGLWVFLHVTLLSAGRVLPVDKLDGRLTLYFQEHWFRVWRGETGWLDLGMFYPVENSLGFSDTFFLFGLTHSLYRFLGFSIGEAAVWNLVTVSLIGFLGFWLLLRRELQVRPWLASAGAGLFISLSPITRGLYASHPQVLGVWFIPWILLAGLALLRRREEPLRRQLLPAAACAGGLAALLFSTFYTGWFLVFLTCLSALGTWLLGSLSVGRPRSEAGAWELPLRASLGPTRACWRAMRRHWPTGLLAAALGGLCLLPFVATYLPVLLSQGGFSFDAALNALPRPASLINPSPHNLLWGWLGPQLLGPYASGGERGFGLPLATMVLALIAMASLWWRRPRARIEAGIDSAWLLRATVPGVLLAWGLMLRFGDGSAWALVFHTVPGAGAIRAVFRFNAVLSLFLLAGGMLWLEHRLRATTPNSGPLRRALVGGFLVLVLIEQWQVAPPPEPWALAPAEIKERIDRLPPPPTGIEAFWVVPAHDNPPYDLMVATLDAWAVTQRNGVPTVNGFSGVFPDRFPFARDLGGSVEALRLRAVQWLAAHHAEGPFGELDLATGKWAVLHPEDLALDDFYPLGFRLEGGTVRAGQSPVGRLTRFATGPGWSASEPDRTWILGSGADVTLRLSEIPPGHSLTLKLEAKPYLPTGTTRQRIRVTVNGQFAGEFNFTDAREPMVRFLNFPAAYAGEDRVVRLQFDCPDAVSPQSLGLSDDARALAIAIYGFEIFAERPH